MYQILAKLLNSSYSFCCSQLRCIAQYRLLFTIIPWRFSSKKYCYWSSWELFSDQYLQFCQLTAPNKWKCTWCEEINSSYTFRSITWLKFLRTSSVFNKMFTRSSHGVHLHKMACCLLFMDMPPTLFCHYRLHSGSKINEGLNAVSYLYATRSGSRWWIL